MIDQDKVQAFNAKPKVDINNIKKMTAGQLDQVKVYGSNAENLLKNRDFALFVHHFKFDLADELSGIKGHTLDDNARRISIAHNIAGIVNLFRALVFVFGPVLRCQAPDLASHLGSKYLY